jgi:hypothetical protein
MVISCHYGGAAKALNGAANPVIISRHEDPADQSSLLHTTIHVLYQWFPIDFGDWFSWEPTGIEPGGDYGYCGIRLH